MVACHGLEGVADGLEGVADALGKHGDWVEVAEGVHACSRGQQRNMYIFSEIKWSVDI